MKAKLTQNFSIAPEGHTVVHFKAGDEVSGAIAERAVAEGIAIEIGSIAPLETKVEEPTETKKKPRKRKLFRS